MPPTWKTVWLWLSEQTHIPITWQFQFLTWPSLWCTPRTWPRTRTAEFFPPATHWNQPKCPSRRGWIKMQAVHSIQPCRAGQISVQVPQGDHVHTLHRQHGLHAHLFLTPRVTDSVTVWRGPCSPPGADQISPGPGHNRLAEVSLFTGMAPSFLSR